MDFSKFPHICGEGVKVDKSNILEIKELPKPKTITQLRFSHFLVPLTNLSKKDKFVQPNLYDSQGGNVFLSHIGNPKFFFAIHC